MRWAFLIVSLLVTAVGVGFVGPVGDEGCRDDPHPGIGVSDHYAGTRAWPPVWACRYDLHAGGTEWADPKYGGLLIALGLALLLGVLIARFRHDPPPAIQGLVAAWLTVATYGAFSSFGVEAAWGATLIAAVPAIAWAQRDLSIPRALPWWWAALIATVAWLLTVATSFAGDTMGNPLPALAAGAALGAGYRSIARIAGTDARQTSPSR